MVELTCYCFSHVGLCNILLYAYIVLVYITDEESDGYSSTPNSTGMAECLQNAVHPWWLSEEQLFMYVCLQSLSKHLVPNKKM